MNVRHISSPCCAIVLALCLSGCSLFGHRAPKYKWGFVDKNGKLVIAQTFSAVNGFHAYAEPDINDDPVQNFHEGLAAVAVGELWGYIDKTGKMVIPAQFTEAGNFSEGLACVARDGKFGFIDKTGQTAIDFDPYQNRRLGVTQSEFHDGLAPFQEKAGDKFGYCDKSGKFVIPPIYLDARPFADGLALVEKRFDDHYIWCVIDAAGKEIFFKTNLKYAGEGKFIESLSADEHYYCDSNGKRFSGALQLANSFSDGLAVAVNAGEFKWIHNIVNRNAYTVATATLEGAGDFREGLCPAAITNSRMSPVKLWGFIDRQGQWRIPATYINCQPFYDGIAAVTTKGKLSGYINHKGEMVIAPKYNRAHNFSEGLAAVGTQQGLID